MMPERSKDYIRGERKPNGYQSLHETIYGAFERGCSFLLLDKLLLYIRGERKPNGYQSLHKTIYCVR